MGGQWCLTPTPKQNAGALSATQNLRQIAGETHLQLGMPTYHPRDPTVVVTHLHTQSLCPHTYTEPSTITAGVLF